MVSVAQDVYEEFLKFLAFEEDEIPEFMPHLRNGLEVMGITKDDVKFSAM
jgi:hypothetical protein